MTQNTPSIKRWAWPVRIAWVILFFILLTFFVGGIPYRYGELVEPCAGESCPLLTITAEEAKLLQAWGIATGAYAIFHIAAEGVLGFLLITPAILFLWRRLDDVMGIFAAFLLLLLGLNFMVESDTSFVHHNLSLQHLFNVLTALAIVPLVLLPFIFPNGRFVPRWTRYIAAVLVFLLLLDPVVKLITNTPLKHQFSTLANIIMIVGLMIGIGAQVYRYRAVSTAVEKQQTKWVIFALSLLIFCVSFWSLFFDMYPPPPGPIRLLMYTVLFAILFFFLAFFPASIVIAIVRYNLFDIDLIIRRTLLYTLTTGLLALVYFTSVVLIQSTITAVGGQPSQAVIILSTLLIAALFNPLRRRLQSAIDKRFYRSKYNAQQTLARFAATARDEVDLERLSAELVAVIRDTMQPETVSLWLKRTDNDASKLPN